MSESGPAMQPPNVPGSAMEVDAGGEEPKYGGFTRFEIELEVSLPSTLPKFPLLDSENILACLKSFEYCIGS